MKQYDSAIGNVVSTKPKRFRALSSRCGVFPYLIDGKLVWQLRDEDEVFNEESVNSFVDAVITIGHPEDDEELSETHGAIYSSEVVINSDDNEQESGIYTEFIVFTEEARELAGSGIPTSPMYDVMLVEKQGDYNGQKYDYVQKNIRYTSLGLVPSARQEKTKVFYQLSKDSIFVPNTNLIEIPQINMKTNIKPLVPPSTPTTPNVVTDSVTQEDSATTEEIVVDTQEIDTTSEETPINEEETEEKKEVVSDSAQVPAETSTNFVINSEGGVNVNKDYLDETIDVAMRAEEMGLLTFNEAMMYSLSSLDTVMKMILLKEGIEIGEWESARGSYRVYMKLRPLNNMGNVSTTTTNADSRNTKVLKLTPVINHPTHTKQQSPLPQQPRLLTFDDLE